MAMVPMTRFRRLEANSEPWAASWPTMNRPEITSADSTHSATTAIGLSKRISPATTRP